MKSFEYFEPETIEEALSLLSRYKEKAKVLAGGTDLIVQIKLKEKSPQYIVNIKYISGLKDIKYDSNDGLRIGTLTTHQSIANSSIIREKFDFLADAAGELGTTQVRNIGTIGGNICNASPSADLAPPLVALSAELKLISPQDERLINIENFYTGPFQTILGWDELLTEIRIPNIEPISGGCYLRLPKLTSIDEVLVGVAVLITLDPEKKLCREIKIGLGSVSPFPMRAKGAESVLKGEKLDDMLIEKAANIAASETSPRSRAEYRREMTRVLTKQALRESLKKSLIN